ncbi:hypothetical protein K502DRAFT_353687 [Neoconidiobolus thromboides FSU 785]|nr:hypothetical protein K502DRAFT_353687 [Neoconidiobolus thromboides FSU 785]
MLQVLISVTFTRSTLGNLSSENTTYVKAKVVAHDIFNSLDRKPTIDCSEDYDNARFSYPARSGMLILQVFCLSILAEKLVVLVGSLYSKKSTIINLIQQFYDLSTGRLNIEEINIKGWSLSYLRSRMVLVGKKLILFGLSITKNIAYGKPNTGEEKTTSAIKMANTYTFILEQLQSYKIKIQECDGEKEELVLLGTTWSRDCEKVVQTAFNDTSEDRTTVAIAHPLSVIQGSDCITAMKRNKPMEIGTQKQLLSIRG